jgi:excisionase family DNA binding protein
VKGFNTNNRRTVTVDEAAQILGVGRNRAYELVHSGELRGIRIGRRWLIPFEAIEEFIERGILGKAA